jgi:hypothetical protein
VERPEYSNALLLKLKGKNSFTAKVKLYRGLSRTKLSTMTPNTASSCSESDHPRRTNDAYRIITRQCDVQNTQDMQRAWNRLEMLKNLEGEARNQRTTIDEIMNPEYTVALPSSNFTGTIGDL